MTMPSEIRRTRIAPRGHSSISSIRDFFGLDLIRSGAGERSDLEGWSGFRARRSITQTVEIGEADPAERRADGV